MVRGWGRGGRGAEARALVHGDRRAPGLCLQQYNQGGSASSRSSAIRASGQGHSVGCSSAPRGLGEAGGATWPAWPTTVTWPPGHWLPEGGPGKARHLPSDPAEATQTAKPLSVLRRPLSWARRQRKRWPFHTLQQPGRLWWWPSLNLHFNQKGRTSKDKGSWLSGLKVQTLR